MERLINRLSAVLWIAAFVSIGFTRDHLWVTAVLFLLAVIVGVVALRVQRRESSARSEEPPPTAE
jgi:hypothetical protein